MSSAKKWIDRLGLDDPGQQCKHDPACHRLDGHDGDCKTLGVVIVEKFESAARRFVTRIRGAS